jgi:hypothetical protein
VRVNHVKVSPEELEEGRRLVAMFRERGASEHEACMLTAELQMAMRCRP